MRAIELFAATDMTRKEIAKELGVSTRTLRMWMKDEEFLSELARRREIDPQSFRTLRLHAARTLVLQMLRRLQESDEALPIKEVVSLLGRLISKDVAAQSPEPPVEQAPEVEQEPLMQQGIFGPRPRLTSEEVERIWQEIEPEESEPKRE
jgi:DNA-binding transcriptional MerR regulator